VAFAGGDDDSSFLIGAEWFRREGLRESDRDWAQCATEHYFDPATGENISMIDPRTGEFKCWGSPANEYIVVNGGADAGRWIRDDTELGAPVGWHNAQTEVELRNFDTPGQRRAHMISPAERISVFAFGTQDFEALGGIELYYEFMYNSRRSEQNSGPRQFAPRVYGSPFSPFAGDSTVDLPLLLLDDTLSQQEVNWVRGLTGLRGEFNDNWSWDIFAGYGRSHGTYSSNQILLDRLVNSLDVFDLGGGDYDCAVNQDPAAAGNFDRGLCVPMDPYAAIGYGLGDGTVGLPQDVLDYIMAIETGATTFQQKIVSGFVSGEVFDLPAGTVGAVFGFELREETINDVPSSGSQTGNLWGFTSSGITAGTEEVKEVFGEVEIPILRGMTGFEELSVSASGRFTDYKTIGSDTTYKVGLNWQIMDWFRLRSSFGTSFRAPALYESFLGGQTAFTSASDPCTDYELTNSPGDTLYDNCLADGVFFGHAGFTSTPRIITFGNAGRLEAETSESFTFGGIVTLDRRIDLSFAVDYFDLTVKGEIAKFGPASILSQCFNDPLFRTPGTVCDFVDPRDAQLNITEINDSYFNINEKNIEGVDLTIRYSFDINAVNFVIDSRSTKIMEFTRTLFGDVLDDLNNQISLPDFNSQLDITATYEAWTVYWGIDMIGGQDDYAAFNTTYAACECILDTPDVYYHDASVRYNHENGWSAQLGLSNIFDKAPPKVSDQEQRLAGGTAFHSSYDLRGRSIFVNLSKDF
jgi:iron complex outermembrane receptor protein